MAKVISLFLLLTACLSCYHEPPGPSFDKSVILPPDSMVSLLTDIHLLEGVVNIGLLKDSALTSLSESKLNIVLHKHRLDRRAFEENVHYYTYHTEDLDRIYEQVIINLSKLESEMSAGKAKPEE